MTDDLVDTHCHIHEATDSFTDESDTRSRWRREGSLTPDAMIKSAAEVGVTRLICVGTTLVDSKLAIDFVKTRPQCRASIGIHPHEAKDHLSKVVLEKFASLHDAYNVVAVGECGLDYFYKHSQKLDQEKVLRFQIELALQSDLPLIFHIRDAFPDFWKIYDDYKGIHGVIHSFSASPIELDQVLARELYVGLNGIMTFTKNVEQLAAAKQVPLNKLVLETDAPFLTPAPYRGTMCEPKHVRVTAAFLANLRGENSELFDKETTRNARDLFRL